MHRSIIIDSVTNTKLATVLLTLGRKLREKDAIFIQYDRENPKSSGGKAHFIFDSNVANQIQKDAITYDLGTADVELDAFIEDLDLTADKKQGLEQKVFDAYLVIGRRVLDNYQVLVRDLKTEIAKVVVTGGTPVYDGDGQFAGIQDFRIRIVK